MAITEPLIPHRLTPWKFCSLGGIMMLAAGVVLFSLFGAVPVTVRYSNTVSHPMVRLRSGSSQVWPNGGTNARSDLENVDKKFVASLNVTAQAMADVDVHVMAVAHNTASTFAQLGRVEELLKQLASACAVGFIYNGSEGSPQKRCIPAPCDVANADSESGPGSCACRNGFHSSLAWSGVAWTGSCEVSCVLPRSTTGYNTRSCATSGGAIPASSCTVTCAAFFTGNASATCLVPGEVALSGCKPFQFGLAPRGKRWLRHDPSAGPNDGYTTGIDMSWHPGNGWIRVDSIEMLTTMKDAFITFYNEHHLPALTSWSVGTCYITMATERDKEERDFFLLHGFGVHNKNSSVTSIIYGHLDPSMVEKGGPRDGCVLGDVVRGTQYMLGAALTALNSSDTFVQVDSGPFEKMYAEPTTALWYNPSGEDVVVEVAAMKKAETKTGDGKADLAVVAAYKKAYADNGGDKAKVCAALGLEEAKWPAGGEKEFLAMYLG